MANDIIHELEAYLQEAEEWLLNYTARLRQWQIDSNSIREESNTPEVYVRTGPGGNIVVQKIVSLAQLDYAENWLLAVEAVVESLDDERKEFLAVRRDANLKMREKKVKGCPAWRGYVKTNYPFQTLTDKMISDWWINMVELMRLVALKRGCYKK